MKTFYLYNGEGCYGEVTEQEHETISQAISEAVENKFGVKVEFTSNAYTDNDSEIQSWVNDNWADVAAQTLDW